MPEATESKQGKSLEMQRLMALDVLIRNLASRKSLRAHLYLRVRYQQTGSRLIAIQLALQTVLA